MPESKCTELDSEGETKRSHKWWDHSGVALKKLAQTREAVCGNKGENYYKPSSSFRESSW